MFCLLIPIVCQSFCLFLLQIPQIWLTFFPPPISPANITTKGCLSASSEKLQKFLSPTKKEIKKFTNQECTSTSETQNQYNYPYQPCRRTPARRLRQRRDGFACFCHQNTPPRIPYSNPFSATGETGCKYGDLNFESGTTDKRTWNWS